MVIRTKFAESETENLTTTHSDSRGCKACVRHMTQMSIHKLRYTQPAVCFSSHFQLQLQSMFSLEMFFF